VKRSYPGTLGVDKKGGESTPKVLNRRIWGASFEGIGSTDNEWSRREWEDAAQPPHPVTKEFPNYERLFRGEDLKTLTKNGMNRKRGKKPLREGGGPRYRKGDQTAHDSTGKGEN